jgi:hypothetical protein
MSDDDKKSIDWLTAELAKRGHKNFRWAGPEDVLPHLQVRKVLVHDAPWLADTPLPLRDAAGKVVPIHPAVEREEALPIRPVKTVTLGTAVERDQAMPIQPIGGATEESDTLRASGTVTFDSDQPDNGPVHVYPSHPDDDHSEKCGGSAPPPRRIALPPGYGMERLTRCLFFFARVTPREFEEIRGDYEYNMIEAEAKGATAAALWLLRIKYWGAYLYTLAVRIPAGIVGQIIQAIKGG